MNIDGFKSLNGVKVDSTDSSKMQVNQSFGVKTFSSKNNADSVSFGGLTRYFSAGHRNAEDLIQAAQKWTKNNGVIGTPPFEWVQKIPKELRKEKIKELYLTFKNVLDILNEGRYKIEESRNILNSAFKKAGIVDKTENISFELLTISGSYGDTYNLSIPISKDKTKHYVLKRFRSHEPESVYSSLVHGNYVEQNRAFSTQNDFYSVPRKISRNKEISREAWHRGDCPNIFFADLNSNYALFEDAKFLPTPLRHISLDKSGLDLQDLNLKNFVNEYHIDYGGKVIENQFIASNKTARHVYRKVMNSTYPFQKLAFYIKNAHKMKNTQDIYTGITAVVLNIENNWRLKDFQFPFDFKMKFVQKIFDRIQSRMNPSKAKTYLSGLIEKHKQEVEHQRRMVDLLGIK